MRTSKKIVSLVLAVMMVVSMMAVMAVSASALAVAKIGDNGYETLKDALDAAVDGDTVVLQSNCAGNGWSAPQGKFNNTGLTVDFNGYTFTMDGEMVGSPGTKTQAFQLLKDNKITFQNGTIYSEKAKMLVQNYCDLTLDNMTLTLNNSSYTGAYTLSNNCGNVVIDDTTINANDANSFAFDVCRYSSYPSVNVTVTGSSVINGDVEVSASKSDPKEGFSLTLESGTLNGEVVIDPSAETAMAAAPAITSITTEDGFVQKAAKIGNTYYDSLKDALDAATDGATVTLLKDSTGDGWSAPQGKFNNTGLTVDFNGYTFTMDGEMVGSPGTKTQAFQLLKDNKITFKNGTIYSEKAKMLVQNYCDLTLDNMTLTLNNSSYTGAYTLSNNCGNVVIDDTTINANDANSFAFDVCRYSSYPSVNVTVTGSSVINGDVEVSASKSDPKDGFSLTLESGTMNGDIVLDQTAKNVIEATPEKVEITKATTFAQVAPEGYIWENGTTLVAVGAEIKGYQKKAVQADADGSGVRILTKIDRDWLEANADSYGYVVAKVQDKDMTANFSAMKKDGGNGEKTIDCTGTYNNGIDGIDNTYVTLAVNGMADGNQVAARFYVVVNGKTYYANYINTISYDGIIATYKAA